ncbi:MAG: transcriptional repressor NrdR [Myxococcales bacterium]|nr:transcriptional repressor NrdR [Myxococcales bacterium]
MQCPFCASDSAVTETRDSADGVRRRRVCATCKRRFTTYEKVGSPGLKVEKRDGSHEPFDSDKLYRTLGRVARHRAGVIDGDDLRRIVRDVEATLVDRAARSVRWSDIVRLVLERLRAIDRVSADRLEASYRDERGAVRLDEADPPAATRPQLGLFRNDE